MNADLLREVLANKEAAEEATPIAREITQKVFADHPQIKLGDNVPRITVTFGKYKSDRCQKCGEQIGWIGRFLLPFLHNCNDPI